MNLIEKAFLKATEQKEKKIINLKKKFPNWTYQKGTENTTNKLKK
tara:strand:+ start:424 stop:558 length:135 start_codon:yes stop_codon:yes gene_type:complete